MRPADAPLYAEWLEVLRSLWTAYDKPMDEKLFGVYTGEFTSIPLGLLEKAVGRCKRTCTFFPRISELWKAIREECALADVSDPENYIASIPTGIFVCLPDGWKTV